MSPPPVARLVSSLRCIGINYMPGSVYVIISTADLPLNTARHRLGAGTRPSRFPMKIHFVRGFCMGAQDVLTAQNGDSRPGQIMSRLLLKKHFEPLQYRPRRPGAVKRH
jgi:hypothetical protein